MSTAETAATQVYYPSPPLDAAALGAADGMPDEELDPPDTVRLLVGVAVVAPVP